jgi:abequosyltransferase
LTIKLSICIPTYNRGDEIKYLLDSILVQDSEFIEIVISDNCSSDNTQQIVNEYLSRFVNISYYRLPSNLGPDINFINVVKYARGEYCWLFGSDDAMIPGAIQKMLQFCNNNFDFALLNLLEADFSLNVFGSHNWMKNVESNCIYQLDSDDKKVDFFYNSQPLLGLFMGYITSVVVKKSKWNSVAGIENWIGSYFSFTYVLVSLINKGCIIQYVNEYLFLNRGHNDSISFGNSKTSQAQRSIIDIDAYLNMSKIFTSKKVQDAFLNIGVRNYTWYPLLRLRILLSKKQWDQVVQKKLHLLGIRPRLIRLINFMGMFSGFLFLILSFKKKYFPKKRIIPRTIYIL